MWISLINEIVTFLLAGWTWPPPDADVLEVDFILQNCTANETSTDCSMSFPPPQAIYLCKRTMQNKARLELADYEAVSPLLSLLFVRK